MRKNFTLKLLVIAILAVSATTYFFLFTKPYDDVIVGDKVEIDKSIPSGLSVRVGWDFATAIVLHKSPCNSRKLSPVADSIKHDFYGMNGTTYDFCVEDHADGRHYYFNDSLKVLPKDKAVMIMDDAVSNVISHYNTKITTRHSWSQ